ncbi:hypothetical protein FORC31_p325 (plasmid) [Escherichia coli]|nr:hypothetical protein FORC31_p325 [Escherichia coli]
MATVGGSESLTVTLRPDEFFEALIIGIDALGLCVIVLWRTMNGQFIPQPQQS